MAFFSIFFTLTLSQYDYAVPSTGSPLFFVFSVSISFWSLSFSSYDTLFWFMIKNFTYDLNFSMTSFACCYVFWVVDQFLKVCYDDILRFWLADKELLSLCYDLLLSASWLFFPLFSSVSRFRAPSEGTIFPLVKVG